ncbi:hypothetical protein MAR_001920, partial [Mya arenaria]
TSPEEIFNEICPDNAATKVQAYQALTNCGKNPISQSMQDDLLGSDDHNDEEFIESLIQQGDTGEGGNQDGKLDYAVVVVVVESNFKF